MRPESIPSRTHPDPARDRLHQWIRGHTAPDAAFVDSELTIPVFAGRGLLVALDPRASWIPHFGSLEGWTVTPGTYLRWVFGHSREEIARRLALTRALLDPAAPPLADEAVAELAATAKGELFVVARDERASERLAQHARFERVLPLGPGGVYALRGR